MDIVMLLVIGFFILLTLIGGVALIPQAKIDAVPFKQVVVFCLCTAVLGWILVGVFMVQPVIVLFVILPVFAFAVTRVFWRNLDTNEKDTGDD